MRVSERYGNNMKATGIVRRIDDLGRIVIPKEIRRTLRIKESDPLEIFTEKDGSIILKKYSPIGDIAEIAKPYVESLAQVSGHVALIADRDQIIAAAGTGSKGFIGQRLSQEILDRLNARETICAAGTDEKYAPVTEQEAACYAHQVVIPILAHGDLMGAVILLSKEDKNPMDEVEMKLAQSAAAFLGKQIEQ